MILDDAFRLQLVELAARDRLRQTRTFGGLDRIHPEDIEGRSLLSFCSNDYLALCTHPALAEAAGLATAHRGFGAGASRLVSGESPDHRALETQLAAFLERPAVLLFPTGYQTNLGVVTALAGPTDLIVSDAANHASIIDGCRLSRARTVVYRHCDPIAARQAITTPGQFRRRILVTESVFSMDGDRAPLSQLSAVAVDHDAALVVDEAHALGVIGPAGRGLSAELGVVPDVLIGTLGKAFGSLGGFASGSALFRDVLINTARQFIYSTACPPALAAATTAALQILSGPEGRSRRDQARALANRLRMGLARMGIPITGQDLIIPVLLGNDQVALKASSALLARGILVPAIRPPSVPEGTARLRITVSAAHSPQDIDRLLDALAGVLVPQHHP